MAHRIVRTYIAIEQQDHGTTLRHSSLLPNHHVATWWQIRSILWQSRLHAQNLHYPTPIMKSGTYRIVNLSNEKAIADDDNKIVFSRKEDSKDQQWFVQRAGDGYRFKNVASGGYLAVVVNGKYDSESQIAYSGRYPMTWMLVSDPNNTGRTIYGWQTPIICSMYPRTGSATMILSSARFHMATRICHPSRRVEHGNSNS
ncbi:hypothetical protein ACGC1H_005017 [Rhizoctonia solani]